MCRQTSLTTTFSYYEGRYNMFEILGPKRTYYFDNIVTPSAYILSYSLVSSLSRVYHWQDRMLLGIFEHQKSQTLTHSSNL